MATVDGPRRGRPEPAARGPRPAPGRPAGRGRRCEASPRSAVDVVISQDPRAGQRRRPSIGGDHRGQRRGGDGAGARACWASTCSRPPRRCRPPGFVVQQEQAEDPSEQYDEGQIWFQNPPGGHDRARSGSVVIIRVVPVPPSTTRARRRCRPSRRRPPRHLPRPPRPTVPPTVAPGRAPASVQRLSGDGGAGPGRGRCRSRSWPCSVRIDSGWNCTPSTSSSRWRRPMTTPSSVRAVTSSTSGTESALDDEGVVAGGLERAGQAGEHAGTLVADRRGLAVHDRRRPDDVAAVDLADALVAEADAEDRHPSGEGGDDVVGQAGVLGAARPGADEHGVGGEGLDVVQREGVAAVHDGLGAQLARGTGRGCRRTSRSCR